MEHIDKGLTVPKWVLIVWSKIPQMPQNSSAQFVCPSPKFLDFNAKKLHWAYVVRVLTFPSTISRDIFSAKRQKKSQNVLGNKTCDRNIVLAPFFR